MIDLEKLKVELTNRENPSSGIQFASTIDLFKILNRATTAEKL